MIRELQPKCVIWNDNGDRADLRWVGTEAGYVGETNWSLLHKTGDVPEEMLRYWVEDGNAWVPGEVNTSIRPGWFYHEYEDSRVKNLPQLMKTYYQSIGRNGTFLLNFPIDKNGLIHPTDEYEALNLAKAVKEAFAVNLAENAKVSATNIRGINDQFSATNVIDNKKDTYWATDDSVIKASLTIDLGKPTPCNRFLVQEYIRLGQRVKSFTLEAFVNGEWQVLKDQLVSKGNGTTTIGYKRIICFPTIQASKLRFTIDDAKACPVIANIEVYNAPQILTAPTIIRNQAGEITITPSDVESSIFFTIDGNEPTAKSTKYNIPFTTDGKLEVKAIAYDATTCKSSTVAHEKFDIPRNNWKIVSTEDPKVYQIIDGNPSTNWHNGSDKTLPVDLVIDLGKEEKIAGFRYLPDQSMWSPGIITNYLFFVSGDNNAWELADEGEFSNIKNNPLWQTKRFYSKKGRYIKLTALKNTEGNNNIGYAEIDVITE